MKYELRHVYGFSETKVFVIDLYNEETGIGIELRLTDQSCNDFKWVYGSFLKWLQDMVGVPMDPDGIITAFEIFKNAHKDDMSYQELADKLYREGAEISEDL